MSKMSDENILTATEVAADILSKQRAATIRKLAEGLEAVAALEWFTKQLKNGRIVEIAAAYFDGTEYEMVRLGYEKGGDSDFLVDHDLLSLYKRAKAVLP